VEPESVATSGRRALEHTSGEFVTGIYDRAGRRLAGRGPRRLESDLRGSLDGTVATQRGSHLRVGVPIGVRPTAGVVRAVAASGNVRSRVLRAWVLLGAFGLLAISAAAALAWWLSRRLDAPLVRLASAAHRVGDGDFTSRAPRSGIAEIDGVAEAIDTTAGRLGAALDRERSFSADVSHQLRTRVTGLRVTLEAAVVTGSSSDEAMRRAIRETDRLEETIDDLLALARDPGGERAPLDVPAMLDDIERAWHGQFADVGRPLRVEIDHDTPSPQVSGIAARHIVEILVDNAMRHGRGEVRITTRSTHDGVAIDVADEGPGVTITPDELFRRRAGGGDGHGIGLALARSLAEAEGGRLVASRPSSGARFTLLLPRSTTR
jgi:signal transduction histidine kinase